MEFTPKKSTVSYNSNSVRRNPYSSGGKNYLKNFKNRGSPGNTPRSFYGTPPRNSSPKLFGSRGDKMVSSALKPLPQADEATSIGKWLGKKTTSPQPTKRPFSDVNGSDNVKDPYNVFSDSDDEIFIHPRKELKPSPDSDKENSLFGPPKPNSIKVYSNKKKPVNLSRSRLLNDISPEKVERSYGQKCSTSAEKENVPTVSTTEPVPITAPHLIGFPNYGNTCYLNAVIQALFGLPSFLMDYRTVSSVLDMAHTSLFYGLRQVLSGRAKGQTSGVKKSLKILKDNLERVDGSFSGFKMQDANEFLTRVLDTIKDEIDRCHMTTPSPDRPTSSVSAGCSTTDDDIFLNNAVKTVAYGTCGSDVTLDDDQDETHNSAICRNKTDDQAQEIGSNIDESNGLDRLSCTQMDTPTKTCTSDSMPRNPVKDNFEFQLLESYRCLGCGEVEGRKQEYFGLYVNLPEEDRESIQDAISSYMSADERELNCEKCQHNRSSVVTTITRLPRILIVQLKRYEYKQEQCESIKMSSRVQVNNWISLDPFLTDEVIAPTQWNPNSSSPVVPRPPKQPTLTVRNLSSELNMCDSSKDKEEPSSPSKTVEPVPITVPDNEDEELQEVMRRSMNDIGGEDDDIQQAIRLSLQDLGMSYSQENQAEVVEEDGELPSKEDEVVEVDFKNGQHPYKLMSVISHFGLTTNTGHYVSDVYNCEEESWFHYDDETVTRILESVVFADGRQKNGYIFFYVHKDLIQQFEKKAQDDR